MKIVGKNYFEPLSAEQFINITMDTKYSYLKKEIKEWEKYCIDEGFGHMMILLGRKNCGKDIFIGSREVNIVVAYLKILGYSDVAPMKNNIGNNLYRIKSPPHRYTLNNPWEEGILIHAYY